MISDDADEHTENALEQDTDSDSDSEAIILLSHRMAKASEVKEDFLNMAFDDEELTRHTRARDVQVTINQFMMLPQLIQRASRWIEIKILKNIKNWINTIKIYQKEYFIY